jgi:hypothetical protein
MTSLRAVLMLTATSRVRMRSTRMSIGSPRPRSAA